MNDSVQCRQCGKTVHVGKSHGEMLEVDLKENNVHMVVRRFRARCPDCGPFFHDRIGHNGTTTKKQMTGYFPRREQRRLRDALPEDERKPFMQCMAGTREPKEGEVERWFAVLAEIISKRE